MESLAKPLQHLALPELQVHVVLSGDIEEKFCLQEVTFLLIKQSVCKTNKYALLTSFKHILHAGQDISGEKIPSANYFIFP